MRKIFSIILTISMVITSSATSYERLSARMNDHFYHAEWKEVLQEAQKMVKERPTDVEPYSAAIIAAQFLNDIPAENHYLLMSQGNRIHIDSLLNNVYVRTKLIHNAHVYEQLLLNLKANNRWLARVFNIYLLEFYDFARKTRQTIDTANELLAITPDNIRFKKIKANALFYQGDSDEAIEIYEEVLQKDSTDYEILTFLGAYYAHQDHKAINAIDSAYLQDAHPIDSVYTAQKQAVINHNIPRTIELLQRAHTQRPSTHIANQIEQLSNISAQLPLKNNNTKSDRRAK
ncbi:MAG: hypothetical protein IJE18_04145 [Bacteroidaceae bacterium]|nr:hypothetical protein [Bacteroidales bacterium]MBQ2979286.1 hypothetical protein [Bacteroidaceae bacterium]